MHLRNIICWLRSVPNVDIALRQRKHWPNIMLKSQICFKITSYFCRSKEGSIVLKINKEKNAADFCDTCFQVKKLCVGEGGQGGWGRREGDHVGSGEDKLKCVHCEVAVYHNQAGKLVRNVRAFRMTSLGMSPEVVQQVIGPSQIPLSFSRNVNSKSLHHYPAGSKKQYLSWIKWQSS